MEDLVGVGAGGLVVYVDIGGDGEADEEGGFVGVVVGEFDADGEALDDFDEVAGGVFGGEEGEGGAGAHGEAGDAALEFLAAAVHVDIEIDGQADAEFGELGFLEVGVHPDFGEGSEGHEALAGDDVIAGVHFAAGDDAIDFGVDVGIGEVEVGLVEVTVGLEEFGLGLFDGGSVFEDLFVDFVDVARGVTAVELGDHVFGGLIEGGGGDAELGGGLEESGLGLADGGKGLVEVGRDLGEVVAGLGFWGEAEGDADLIDGLERFLETGFGDGEGFFSGFEFVGRDVAGFEEGESTVVIALGFDEGGFLGFETGGFGV